MPTYSLHVVTEMFIEAMDAAEAYDREQAIQRLYDLYKAHLPREDCTAVEEALEADLKAERQRAFVFKEEAKNQKAQADRYREAYQNLLAAKIPTDKA